MEYSVLHLLSAKKKSYKKIFSPNWYFGSICFFVSHALVLDNIFLDQRPVSGFSHLIFQALSILYLLGFILCRTLSEGGKNYSSTTEMSKWEICAYTLCSCIALIKTDTYLKRPCLLRASVSQKNTSQWCFCNSWYAKCLLSKVILMVR